jgi:DNA-dependent protein kinase catalytic subunit
MCYHCPAESSFLYLQDFILGDETFLFVNSSLKSLNHLLYDEFIRSVLKIVEKLDLTLEKQTVGEQEVSRAYQ